ncbi:uncharacterized protein LOC113346365 [Papaver somniferum]|uniref:uncharacterized protein LOC113346365 n=1 Tax=Papaver somniferum TaxID=3469 RepID=UPI000E6FB3EF|nr:uncharacterized protein LOC113346365 [Papaver somniferum]
MDTIPRLKLFIWKCAKDIICSKKSMNKRIPQETIMCCRCKIHTETTLHIILECPLEKAVWFGAGYIIPNELWNNPKDWISKWIMESDRYLIAKMATTCWYLWKERCNAVYDNKFSSPQQSLHCINSFLNDMSLVTKPSTQLTRNVAIPKWLPPDLYFVKVNTDVSFCHLTSTRGYGLIFRNFGGAHVASRSVVFKGPAGAEYLECLAVLESIKMASELKFQKIVIETDYLSLVQAIQRKDAYIPWEHRGLVEDILFLLESFVSWSCTHVDRLANKCADELAKFSRKVSQTHG